MARLIDKLIGTPEARKTYRDAKTRLDRATEQNDEDLAATRDVIDAEQDLPAWRRYPTGPAA